jgi:hypothetical protein
MNVLTAGALAHGEGVDAETLIDGRNLLALLAKHGYKFKIDLA